MDNKEINANSDFHSLLNISRHYDPLLAERDIRAAAQVALAQAIIRSVKVGFKNVVAVMTHASELQKEHSKKVYGAV